MYYSTPFSSWEEWRFVHSSFFPPADGAADNPSHRLEVLYTALLVVKVWEARGAKVPPAVSVTAQLVELKYNQDFITSQLRSVRLAMAMTVIKAVNVVVDELQDQAFAQSIQMLAAKAGLPRWLVDVRHEAAHGVLPSRELLVTAIDTLLEFFKGHYWEKQANSSVEGLRTEEYVSSTLNNCANGSFASISKLDDAIDKLAKGTRTSTLESLLVPKLVSNLSATMSLTPWERVLAGLCDKLTNCSFVLFDALCDKLLNDDDTAVAGANANSLFWLQYLMSRKWHSLSDPSVSRTPQGKTLILQDESSWTAAESSWMLTAAEPELNRVYRCERWLRDALRNPHPGAQELLRCLSNAMFASSAKKRKRIEELVSIYNRKRMKGDDFVQPSLEEVEQFVLARGDKSSPSLDDGISTCTLAQTKSCTEWTIVSDFGQCPIGLVPEECPVPGVLTAFSEEYFCARKLTPMPTPTKQRLPLMHQETEKAATTQQEKAASSQILDVKLLL